MKLKKNLRRVGIGLSVLGLIVGSGIWMNMQQMEHTTYVNHAMKDSDEYEMLSFEEYLGEDINLLKGEEINKIKGVYEKIAENEEKEKFDEADKLWDEFDDLLREAGIAVVYKDFMDFAETIKSELSEKDFDKLNTIYEHIEKMNEQLEEVDDEDEKQIEKMEAKVEKSYEQMKEILSPLGYDVDEIMAHIEAKSILIALYDVHDEKIQYKPVNKQTMDELSKEDIKKHKDLWEKAKKIIPTSYLERITSFEINTDGKEEVLAHVESPDESNKIWRLAIDIKDAFDQDGKFNKELDKTIIHEFGHILTLNDGQMMKERNENSITYTTDEGSTTKDSYLNQFYNEFWKSIHKEWEKASESVNDDSEENQALIDFYEEHKNEFVSEYASTNPEEDIAESFTNFIVEDKPKGNTIAQRKILFFYQFEELIKIREEIKIVT
ncbi:hypothetical protein IZY60_00190 [Lutibacter sp. B2]|nr:hypothetical protein [Lutibacter sp. B2]